MRCSLAALHIRAILRRWGISLILVLISAAAVIVSQVLQQAIDRQQKTLDTMAQQSEICCIVTTPSGAINGIDIPITTVEELTGRRKTELSAWADVVYASGQQTLKEPEGLSLVHVLNLESDPALRSVNGAAVKFYNNCNEGSLQTDEPLCLLPTSLKGLAKEDDNGDMVLEIKSFSDTSVKLIVMGEISNTRVQAIYCPFFLSIDDEYKVDTCSFTLPSGCDTEEARTALYQYFDEPGPDAERTGLLIQDTQYSLTWQQLSGNLRMLRILRPLLLIFIGCIGAFGGWLSVHGRRRELAVMRCMGLSRSSIFAALLEEHIVLIMLGGALGFALSYWINKNIAGAGTAYSAAILVALLLGTTISGLYETRLDVIKLMKVEG